MKVTHTGFISVRSSRPDINIRTVFIALLETVRQNHGHRTM